MSDNAPFDFASTNGYDQGFFECWKDPLYCLFSCFCPCIVIGKTKGEIDGTKFDFLSCLFCPIATYRNRRRIQDMYNHHESEDGSMIAAVCCNCCAITQDVHEFNVRNPGRQSEAPASERAPAANA